MSGASPIELAAEAKFEDHPSFVFLNRRLPVPQFTADTHDGTLTITTDALKLHFEPTRLGNEFAPTNISLTLRVDGKAVEWRPGTVDTGNLQGTARTLDGVRGDRATLESGSFQGTAGYS